MIREERTEGGGGTYISQLEINQNSWETLGDPVEITLGDDQLVLSEYTKCDKNSIVGVFRIS